MAKKINMELILELRNAGMGQNAIAASRHISKNSVICSTSLTGWAYPMRISPRWMRMRFTASFIRTSLSWKICMTSQIMSMSIRN